MGGLNRSILAGRLVADPILRYTENETPVVNFRLAINYVGKNGKQADFVSCVAWGGLAEVCGQYLKKGRLVAVEGRLQNRSYQGKDGQKRFVTEVIINNMQMLDSRVFANEEKVTGQSQKGNYLPTEVKKKVAEIIKV